MRSKVRKVLFWTHLAAGLTVALPIFAMCITGALLMYQTQMQAWMDRWGVKSHPPKPGAQALNVEALIHKTREARGVDPELITVFPSPTQPVEVDLNRKLGSLYLDAYSGAVIGEPSRKTRQFFLKVTAWHVLLGVTGPHGRQSRALVRRANMIVFFLAMLGFYLWIPRRWTWPHLRGIVAPRWGRPGRARDFNWHNSIGIWSVIPILAIAWTGVAMSYGWANRLTSWVVGSANTEWRGGQRTKPAEAPSSSLDALLARAERQSAQWKAITMAVPRDDSDPVDFAIDMSGYGGIGKTAALDLDRTGKVVLFVPAGNRHIATDYIRYGHTGEIWGVAGQTIAGAASLGGAVLVWTGVALSLRRMRSWLARKTS
jgi:uncharacterized iron-regulated membrane protein